MLKIDLLTPLNLYLSMNYLLHSVGLIENIIYLEIALVLRKNFMSWPLKMSNNQTQLRLSVKVTITCRSIIEMSVHIHAPFIHSCHERYIWCPSDLNLPFWCPRLRSDKTKHRERTDGRETESKGWMWLNCWFEHITRTEFGWRERCKGGREETCQSWKLLHHSWKSIRAKEMRHFLKRTQGREKGGGWVERVKGARWVVKMRRGQGDEPDWNA